MSYGITNKIRARNIINQLAEQRNHQIERIFLNPTIGNNILWRSVYKTKEYYYIDAVNVSPFKKNKFYQGSKVGVIDKNNIFSSLSKNSLARNDIKRFAYFSKDYIYLYPYQKNIIADLRYGTLPYDNKSLWGLKIDPKNDKKHGQFISLQNFSKQDYSKFWSLLKGE